MRLALQACRDERHSQPSHFHRCLLGRGIQPLPHHEAIDEWALYCRTLSGEESRIQGRMTALVTLLTLALVVAASVRPCSTRPAWQSGWIMAHARLLDDLCYLAHRIPLGPLRVGILPFIRVRITLHGLFRFCRSLQRSCPRSGPRVHTQGADSMAASASR